MSRIYSFVGGPQGLWHIDSITAVTGDALPLAEFLDVVNTNVATPPAGSSWCLRGVTSYDRYLLGSEKAALAQVQPPIGRPEATLAAFIPIKKSSEWFQLPHDARREILEERSAHIAKGLKHLPAVARRLHHSHDLGEPFDFLTWFEYAPAHSGAFEELVAELRRTEEWAYVEREVDVRLTRATALSN